MLRDGLVKRILTESGDFADLDAAPGIEWPACLGWYPNVCENDLFAGQMVRDHKPQR